MAMPTDDSPAPNDEAPPFGQSWQRLYALVLLELAALVLAFYALTRWAA